MLKNICEQLNIFKQCRKYHLSVWECPHFLTIIIGLITIAEMLITYFVGNKYINQPELIAFIVVVLTFIFVIIGGLMIKSFTSLAEANQMKTEFVSIASHQLRTPLSIIKWTLNAIEEKTDYLKDIEQSNQRMIDLVNDLLNVSRIEQKRIKLEPKKISLKKITQELLKEYALFIKKNNISITADFAKNTIVWVDPKKIKLVIQNFIDNAIKYSIKNKTNKKNIVLIKIKKNNNKILLQVKDNGIGIPQQDQNQIFQKFFRSQNALRYQTQGTGLGLFIAKAFIEQSKGKIGFKSKQNKGSTFWFELPTQNVAS